MLRKFQGNPILAPEPGVDQESMGVLNPGAIVKDGKVYLLYRAAGNPPDYKICANLAVSRDGFTFERQYAVNPSRVSKNFNEQALQMLQRYHWPGNVRELVNVVERAIVLTKRTVIGIEDFPETLRRVERVILILHSPLCAVLLIPHLA